MNLLNNEARWVREALFEQATNSKHDIALRYCDKDDVESYSYSQLISLGYSLATRIEIENNPPGPAILLMPGGSPFVISFIACIIRGCRLSLCISLIILNWAAALTRCLIFWLIVNVNIYSH